MQNSKRSSGFFYLFWWKNVLIANCAEYMNQLNSCSKKTPIEIIKEAGKMDDYIVIISAAVLSLYLKNLIEK